MAAAALPMGLRFRPSDEEKVSFLVCKVTGLPLPCGETIVGTADLYGEKEPWDVFGDSEDGELCFFTRLKKIGKNNNSKRFSRNVGNGGTWSNKGQKLPIFGEKRGGGHLIIGYKRCFRYENKDYAGGTWLLKEYTLPDTFYYTAGGRVKEDYKDYVLCVLKRKQHKGSSKTPPPPVFESIDNNNYFYNNHQAAADQEERNYDQAAADLRDFAQEFIREEQTSSANFIPYYNVHTHHHGNNLFSQTQDAMMMSSYY